MVLADLPLGINVYNFIAQLITFLILLFVLGKFAFPALMKTLDQRELTIRQGVENAELARQAVMDAEKRVGEMLEQGRRDAQDALAKATQAAEHIRVEIEQQAQDRSKDILAQADKRIQQEMAQAKAELSKQIADLAIMAAERVVGTSLDSQANRRLVNDFVAQSKDLQ